MITGRFAPSPTGPLHEGSLVAALASWLDARAQGGRWLVRIEDIDVPREMPGASDTILWQLDRCGLRADATPLKQSTRGDAYHVALDRLLREAWAYPCACSRQEIADSARWPLESAADASVEGVAGRVYRNTCRGGLHGRPGRATRLRVANRPGLSRLRDGEAATSDLDDGQPIVIDWQDRRLGARHDRLANQVGDFVLKRADGHWAYQLAVVVDDAAQGITDVVRGEDLAASTARQIYLQRRLGVPTPRYLHTPLVRGLDGQKLSKQNGAAALVLDGPGNAPLDALRRAGSVLGIDARGTSLADWLADAIVKWRLRWPVTT